ncbi:ABC transporter substrate-binding protein [Pseudoroseicyclus sp. H15]
MTKHPTRILSAGILLAALGTSAAAQDETAAFDAAVAEAQRIAEGQELTGYIEFIGQNSGAEGETLQQVYAAFTEGTGIEVRYTGTPDSPAIIQSRMQAGNPPDVADMQLGIARDYAADGALQDIGAAFGDTMAENFGQALLDTATFDGTLVGVFQGLNPFMVWYNPQAYEGPEAPTDWQALVDYTNSEAEAGNTAWCAAQGAGPSSGFPGAQMVDNLFLKKWGPELYQQWGTGELSWTSDEVRWAFEEFLNVIAAQGHVQGGPIGALSTSIATGYNGLVADPAGCDLVMWGAWTPGLLGDAAVPGENIDFFRVPASDEAYYDAELFQSALAVAFNDRPETMAFLEYMASTPAQTYLASLNRWPVANQNVPAETYPSDLLQRIAEQFLAEGVTSFAAGPNLLADAETSAAYYKGIVSVLQSPDNLTQVLETIEATTAE